MTKKDKIDLIHDAITDEREQGDVCKRIAKRLHALGITDADFRRIMCGPDAVLATSEAISCNVSNRLSDIEKGFVERKPEKVYRKTGKKWE